MSYTDDSTGLQEIDEDELPELTTEEGRDSWIEILMDQDEETIAANGGWCKALVVSDDQGNMVTRFVYPDGREELFDLSVRRSIDVAVVEERN
jgi:hypothetical protein